MNSKIVKVCNKCKVEKEIIEFYKHGKDGCYRGTCKACYSINSREYNRLRSSTGYFVYRLLNSTQKLICHYVNTILLIDTSLLRINKTCKLLIL